MSKKKVRDTDYLFLSALIRARETKSPNREKFERMISAQSYAESARLLTECGYPDLTNADAGQVNAALNACRAGTLDELEKYLPEKCVAESVRIKYDCHNAKAMVKATAANVDGEHLMLACGTVPPEKLMEAYNSSDYSELPGEFAEALEEARGVLARTGNPQLADLSLDKAYFKRLLELGREESSGFLLDYAKTLVDSANLRTLVRTRRMGKDELFLGSMLIEGGSVPEDELKAAFLSGELAAAFSKTVLAQAAKEGERRLGEGSLTAFEQLCDNAVTELLRRAKSVSFGAAPVIAYLASQEQELSSVRMILTGKLAELSADTLRERLRETYA